MDDNSPNSPNKEPSLLEKLLPSNIISEVDTKNDKGDCSNFIPEKNKVI